MGNKSTTIEQQIDLLKKRGMGFEPFDNKKINDFLLDIGYYRLGFYWHHFEKNKEHEYIENTQLKNVIDLYYFDVDLRHLLNKALSRIEINFRTRLIYYVSNHYHDNSVWFVDPSVMNKKGVEVIERNYNDRFRANNKPIKKHHLKHMNDKYAPAWKTLEFLTFGSILKIFKNLKNEELKQKICRSYGVRKVIVFENLMNAVVNVRNKCAHGDVLYDLAISQGLKIVPMITYNNNNRNSLDSCIKVISYFLGQISLDRKNEFDDSVKEIFNKHSNNDVLRGVFEKKSNYIF